MAKTRKLKGFTLVETLVTITVTALLSAILIGYSRNSGDQAILFRDQAKIIGALLRAKNLALQTYAIENGAICGYGAHFDSVTDDFFIFKDLAEPCSASDNKYSGEAEIFEEYQLGRRVKFSVLGFADILFIPPDPTVIIDGDSGKKGDFMITVAAISGSGAKNIKVNDFGQVTAQ